MKTINIKGKEYVPVVERVKEAHKLDKDVSIATEIIGGSISDGGPSRVAVKATVTFKGKTFTGHSQAEFGPGMMGDVALEVAETSAVGRALGFANIGLVDGIASADEMGKVAPATDRPASDKQKEYIRSLMTDDEAGHIDFEAMTSTEASDLITKIKSKPALNPDTDLPFPNKAYYDSKG